MPDYERLERLGAGNFGEVWLVYDRALDVRRAVKYVRPDRVHDPTNLYSEPQTLMQLRHDHIVRVEDAGTEPDGTLYIAMEYLPKGSLEQVHRGRPIPLSAAKKYLCDVCWALEYAHNNEYIHRDMKPANVLISSKGDAKLSDFGLATRVPRGESASPYGYLTHVAPEMFSDGTTSPSSDIYALGVTAYRLVNGDAFLPQLPDLGELQDRVLDGSYPERDHYRPYVPPSLKKLINKAMHVDPAQRYASAAALRRQLESLNIQCDWTWKQKKGKVIYTATAQSAKVAVVVEETPTKRFDISTTRRAGPSGARRVTKDCDSNLPLKRMKQRLRSILSRYVTHGR